MRTIARIACDALSSGSARTVDPPAAGRTSLAPVPWHSGREGRGKVPRAAAVLAAILAVVAIAAPARAQPAPVLEAAATAAARGDSERAIGIYTEAIEGGRLSHADRARALTGRGVVHGNAGAYDRAIEDYDQALAVRPRHAPAFFYRGNAYLGKGEHDRAIEDYDAATRLDPAHAMAFHNRGLAWRRKGENARAIADYDRAIALGGLDRTRRAVAYNNRGIVHAEEGDYESALQDYDNALRLAPDHGAARFNRGRTLFYLGDFAAAVDDFAVGADEEPRDPYNAIWLYLASARTGAGARSRLAERAGRLDPREWPTPAVHLFLARMTPEELLALAADADPAAARARRCQAYFYLGQRALVGGDKAEAVRMFQAALASGESYLAEFSGAEAELGRLGF